MDNNCFYIMNAGRKLPMYCIKTTWAMCRWQKNMFNGKAPALKKGKKHYLVLSCFITKLLRPTQLSFLWLRAKYLCSVICLHLSTVSRAENDVITWREFPTAGKFLLLWWPVGQSCIWWLASGEVFCSVSRSDRGSCTLCLLVEVISVEIVWKLSSCSPNE